MGLQIPVILYFFAGCLGFGADLYRKLKEYIIPGTIVFPEKLPSVEDVQVDATQMWNKGVDKARYASATVLVELSAANPHYLLIGDGKGDLKSS
ncbi:unnamed protein product [Nippostrongylus brasiliensis]|uniref:MICOS complex subunit MIC13 n=1 Tax=Nippostrongylus brasiliensis TaxID=27835 RepID=A0A0N4XTX8_NIPBR|nr:unnamed protein product [Nippostrongylus brasiliensis]